MKWVESNLGQFIKIKHGWPFKSKYFSTEGKYVLLSPGNCNPEGGLKLKGDKEKYYIGDFPDNYLLKENDVLIVMTDLINSAPILGGSLRIPEDTKYLHNQRLGLVEIIEEKKSDIDLNFLYHFFNTQYYRANVRGSATGVTVRHTAPERIYRINIKIPKDINIQKKISFLLDQYNNLIENNNRRIELLEKSAELLYKEWFVNLRFPRYEKADIINGVPTGWEKKKLSIFATVIMGQSPSSKFYNNDNNGLPFHQGVKDFGSRFVTNAVYSSALLRIANPYDILFSVRAPVGRINITIDKIVIGRGLASIRSKFNYQSFLFYQLKNHFFKEDMIGAGVIYASVRKDELNNQKILTPSDDLINQFQDIVIPIDKQIENLTKQNRLLTQARDLLLPKLINGEIEV